MPPGLEILLKRAESLPKEEAQALLTGLTGKILEQCASDGLFWLKFVQTRDEADPDAPVKPFPVQKAYCRSLWADLLVPEPTVIAKSRQMVVSWALAAFCVWWARFRPHQAVYWQTKAWKDAVGMVCMPSGGFAGRCQFIEDGLPPWMRLPYKPSEGRMQYPHNGSMIQALSGGADQIRGTTPSLLIEDEFAHQEDQSGVYCVTPEHRVLRRDLTWVPAGSLGVGDELVGFSESPLPSAHARQWLPATVLAAGRRVLPVYQVVLSDGTRLEATGEHQWLVRKSRDVRWQRTDRLRVHRSRLARQLSVWEPRHDYRAGWLAGFFDGEGHLGRQTLRVLATQREGAVLDHAKEYLTAFGYRWSVRRHEVSGVMSLQILGGMAEAVRFLGEMRPVRLLEKFELSDLGVCRTQQETVEVTAIYGPVPQEVVTLATSTETYLAEGFGAHNTAVAPLIQKKAKLVFASTPNGADNVFATLYHGRPVGTEMLGSANG